MITAPLLFLISLSAVKASKVTATDAFSPFDTAEQHSFTENAQEAIGLVKESLDHASDAASETANSAYSSVLSALLNGDPPCEEIEKDREREACEKVRDQYSVVFV